MIVSSSWGISMFGCRAGIKILWALSHSGTGLGPCHEGRRIISVLWRWTACLPSIRSYFRQKKRRELFTWKRKGDLQWGQIDYIMTSKRWRSCFTNAKVVWKHSKQVQAWWGYGPRIRDVNVQMEGKQDKKGSTHRLEHTKDLHDCLIIPNTV